MEETEEDSHQMRHTQELTNNNAALASSFLKHIHNVLVLKQCNRFKQTINISGT